MPFIDQNLWLAFTQQTVFLRPHVQSLAYCLRVLADQRQAVEREFNGTFHTIDANNVAVPRPYSAEYVPVVYQSANISSYLVDLAGYPILESAIVIAKTTGNVTLSAPYLQGGTWRMGSFLPYYGDYDSQALTLQARQLYCAGYVVTVLSVEEVFGAVMSRYSAVTVFCMPLMRGGYLGVFEECCSIELNRLLRLSNLKISTLGFFWLLFLMAYCKQVNRAPNWVDSSLVVLASTTQSLPYVLGCLLSICFSVWQCGTFPRLSLRKLMLIFFCTWLFEQVQ